MDTQGGSPALVMAVFAALTYDIISATNSSPQTTEINASMRASTLTKWVKIGLFQAVGFAALGAYMEKQRGHSMLPPILGAGAAMVLLWCQYDYALDCGLKSKQPGTEVLGGTG